MSGYKVEICGVNTSKLPLLTNDEKEALFRRIMDGDMDAREQYIKGNLRLVLSVIQRLNEHPVYFFGNGAAKCREKITHPNAHFIDGIHPLAKMMFPLAEKAVATEDYKDVAYFEPFYLKEFVASMPKKLL